MIDQMAQYKVLRTVGTRLLITESGTEIGRDKEQAILYIKDLKNTKQVAVLKAQLRDALKKAGKEDDLGDEGTSAKPTAPTPGNDGSLSDLD
jgi:hypothetical protein